jgi:sigma-B regulation protein RsbU (phosphoserine phosphatase)
MSELVSLLDLFATLNSSVSNEAALDAALEIVMREQQVERGAVFVRRHDGAFEMQASRGLPPGMPATLALGAPPKDLTVLGPEDEADVRNGLALLCPIHHRDRLFAVLGLGPLPEGREYGAKEQGFLRSVAACAASSIENGLIHDELRRVNQQLTGKVFQLHNLFDISRELAGGFEEEAIQSLVITTVMGHFVVSRAALYLIGPLGLALAHERGVRRDAEEAPIPPGEARAALQQLIGPTLVAALPDGPLRHRLEEARMALAVPLVGGAQVEGVLAIGERASRTPFTEEDREFAETLARQAFAALESARLNRLRLEKQRQDHELQIARRIQRSLFPARVPDVPGFEVAGESRSCYEVGGDSYDWIQLGDDRLALVIADVSGKGTPASLLMASVHAYVRALAGTAAPDLVIGRLNRFLYANTETSRFVTLFYAELDAGSRRLAYVNAGHIPPYRVARDGKVSRLEEGGPALGILGGASFEVGQLELEPGDTLAMVTDGVTEANSQDEREFGDEGVCAALRSLLAGSASAILEGLIESVTKWAGAAGCSDDLTALILKVL